MLVISFIIKIIIRKGFLVSFFLWQYRKKFSSYLLLAFLLLSSSSSLSPSLDLTAIFLLSTVSPLWRQEMSGWGTLQPRNTEPLAGDRRNSEEAGKEIKINFLERHYN